MKKLNNKVLIIILLIVAGVFIITEFTGNQERTFRQLIVEVDTVDVDQIVVVPKLGEGNQLTIRKQGNNWMLLSDGKQYSADKQKVEQILQAMVVLEPMRVAATSEDKWESYQVTDSLAPRVQFYSDGQLLSDVYIGKFTFVQSPNQQQNPYMQQQPQGTMVSFVRVNGEDEVYAVEGYLGMMIKTEPDHYRNKILCEINSEDITSVIFQYPNKKFSLFKQDSIWKVNGLLADSAKTVRYLNQFRRLSGGDFIHQPSDSQLRNSFSVHLQGNNLVDVVLSGVPGDSLTAASIMSNLNEEGVFNADRSKLFEKVFVDENEFLPGESNN